MASVQTPDAKMSEFGFPLPTGDPSVLPAGAKLERVFDRACFLTEGISVSPDDGMVYFCDITFTPLCKDPSGKYPGAGNIWRLDPKTRQATIFRSPSGQAAGTKFDAEGNLIIAEGNDFGGRRISKIDMKTGKSYILAGLYNDRPYNGPNDLTIDEKGRIYFTDPRYFGYEAIEQPVLGVYRIDPDGKVTRIITDAGKPNGICVSPDQKTLYVIANDNGSLDQYRMRKGETSQRGLTALLAYALAPDGTVSNRRVLVDWFPNDGGDGMTVDVDGNLYVAVHEPNPALFVYSPEGKVLATIPTGNPHSSNAYWPTNAAFGYGADGNLLYLTAGKFVYAIRMAKQGYQLKRSGRAAVSGRS
jgi:gluconolactonase